MATPSIGTDMLFEQIPASLAFFGFGRVTADERRAVTTLAFRAR